MLERIGTCRIVEEMASGGMAVVYRAIQDDLRRTVAIKALKTSVAADEQLVARFEREAQSLAALQHENIIHIHDFYRERGALFIVMEYVEGIDLYDLLERCDRLPFDVAAVLALQVARALDYIHFRAILHRDIKPANIMVSRQGAVKLMDFGIAQDRSYSHDLTEVGTGIGTPAYMSPEQIVGDKIDARSDIFSLGIVLYQMVTGRKPFIGDEQKTVMQKIRLDPHPSLRSLQQDVPRELERIIDKCLQKKPHDRWPSAHALMMALERFLSKHVEMNYHGRLVLFLKDQGIITNYEAEEYLNPAFTGRLSSAGPAHLAKRQLLRRGLTFQAAIMGVVALMVGIIHLAPLGSTPQPRTLVVPPPERGYLRVVVKPWGHIAINGEDRGTTPLADPIELTAGSHTLTVTNDFFPAVQKTVNVPASTRDDPTPVRIDLEALVAEPAGDDEGRDTPGTSPAAEDDSGGTDP